MSDAEAVFEGEVVSVGEPPGTWRSRIATYQRVDYRVLATGETVSVLHPIVKGAPISDPDTPRLSPELFKPGARFTVRARPRERDGALIALERDGAVPIAD